MAKIKYLKKFEIYNMHVDNNNLYLMCKGDNILYEDYEINDKKLILDTIKLGESINNTINSYYKDEIQEIKDNLLFSDINEEDINELKLHNNILKYSKNDIKYNNIHILNFIKEICYKKNKIDKKEDNNVKSKDIDLKLNELEEEMEIIEDNNFFYHTYKNIYNFLKERNVDIKDLALPSEISRLIDWNNYGIGTKNETDEIINKWKTKETDETNETNETNEFIKKWTTKAKSKERLSKDNFIMDHFNLMLDILDKNKDNFNYAPIIDKINYIPLDIKNFFKYIMENNKNNKKSYSIYKNIIKYVNTYGIPFWTEEIDIPKSDYIYDYIDIPLNNFLLICLSIYVYHELWKFFNNYYDIYDNYDGIEFLNQSLKILNINYTYNEEKETIFNKIGNSIRELDANINYNYNKIYGYNLKIYRNREWDNKNKTFKITYSYENYIIAAWDIFFKYYFGNDNLLYKIEHHTCIECHKEFFNKGHKHNTLCDKCFEIRKKISQRNRTKKFREKKGKSGKNSDKK